MITNFQHGDVLLPGTVNALLRPSYVAVPENDGEFPIPPQIGEESTRAETAEGALANAVVAEQERAEEAESAAVLRLNALEQAVDALTPFRVSLARSGTLNDTVSWAGATGSGLRTLSDDSLYAGKAPLSVLRFGDGVFSLCLDMAVLKANILPSPTSGLLEIRLPQLSVPASVRTWLLTNTGLTQECLFSKEEGAYLPLKAHLFAIEAVPYVVIQFYHISSGDMASWDDLLTNIGSEDYATLQLRFWCAV